MYQISQLMSTPVATKYSSPRSQKQDAGEPSPTCIFPSFHPVLEPEYLFSPVHIQAKNLPKLIMGFREERGECMGKCELFVCFLSDFLDGDSSFECCSTDPLTGSHFTCRRSPRLLTNGYYIWTEDSFLCEKDGHVTLSPSQASVLYKENLVRVFRKKKRTRRSFSSLFNLSASESWLHGSIFGDVDSSPSEDIWLEGVRRLDINHHNAIGGDFDCSLTDDWESEKPNAESVKTSFSGLVTSQTPRENSRNSCLQSQLMASDQENIWDYSKTSLLREVSFQAILLAACLIISACARWFLGGILASVFTCSLVVTIAYVVKSSFLSLANYFKAITCAWFARI